MINLLCNKGINQIFCLNDDTKLYNHPSPKTQNRTDFTNNNKNVVWRNSGFGEMNFEKMVYKNICIVIYI